MNATWWRAGLVLIGASLLFFGAATLEPDWVTTPEQRAVAIATLPCANANQANSSGFVIDDRTVVTVAHAVYGSRDVAVRDVFGRWHRPEVVRLDLEKDIAVLRIDALRATPADRSRDRAVDDWQQTNVTMLDGAASGTLEAVVLRRVKLITEVVGDRSIQAERAGYEVAVDIAPGDSGAGLIDESGAFAGMVFARSTSRESITWATAADEVDATPGPVAEWPCDPAFEAELQLGPRRAPRLP